MEITSPGELYGEISLDTLGLIQPDIRNLAIAVALELLGVTENKYSGIPTIQRELKEYGLPPANFMNDQGEFSICFSLGSGNDIIDYCRIPRTRKEITCFLGLKSATYAINKYIQPLINRGDILLEIPDSPSSPNQRFYSK